MGNGQPPWNNQTRAGPDRPGAGWGEGDKLPAHPGAFILLARGALRSVFRVTRPGQPGPGGLFGVASAASAPPRAAHWRRAALPTRITPNGTLISRRRWSGLRNGIQPARAQAVGPAPPASAAAAIVPQPSVLLIKGRACSLVTLLGLVGAGGGGWARPVAVLPARRRGLARLALGRQFCVRHVLV